MIPPQSPSRRIPPFGAPGSHYAKSEFDGLTDRLVIWHKRKFPHATLYDLGLKTGEESGELQSAILGFLSEIKPDGPYGKGSVQHEAADNMITIMVIITRYMGFSMWDILDELITKKEAEEGIIYD